jgi:hypothetical protein
MHDGRRSTACRVTCAWHEAVIRQTLDADSHTAEIMWGQAAEDEIVRLEERIIEVIDRYGEPPAGYLMRDVESGSREDVPTASGSEDQARPWDAIEMARDELETLRNRPHQEPVVRITSPVSGTTPDSTRKA